MSARPSPRAHGRAPDRRDPPTDFSRWRKRYGKPSGEVTFPLVDGGVYDNEGLNGLRGASVTHAILSDASPPEGDLSHQSALHALAQTVDVMHARLGATTRQLAHEITHGIHPNDARAARLTISEELGRAAQGVPEIGETLARLAERVRASAAVGWPPRGHQFNATAQVLLHSSAVARNVSSKYEEPLDVPAEERGLQEPLVEEISRVRTDLDALEPEVFDLLVAQGYFVADAYLKTGVPDMVRECSGHEPAARIATRLGLGPADRRDGERPSGAHEPAAAPCRSLGEALGSVRAIGSPGTPADRLAGSRNRRCSDRGRCGRAAVLRWRDGLARTSFSVAMKA